MRFSRLLIRPLGRDDGAAVDAVFAGLSARSRFLRFHTPVPRLTRSIRDALLDVDGRRHAALVAELPSRDGMRPIGIARLIGTGATAAETAVAVVDAWQGHGVGRRLLEALGALALDLGYTELHGLALPENDRVIRLLERVFPGSTRRWDDGAVRVRCPLGDPEVTHDDLLTALVS
ncbi:MAG TPA: GNAT family N-acetyltransferase [Pseudonocardia sp.]|nr:GNAT family N-acetyltransferase [Pseudonocardia sp.]